MKKLILMLGLAAFVATANAQVAGQAVSKDKQKITVKAGSSDKKVKTGTSKTESTKKVQNGTKKKVADNKISTNQANAAATKEEKHLSTSSSAEAAPTNEKKVVKQPANDVAGATNTVDAAPSTTKLSAQKQNAEASENAEKAKLQGMMKDENIPMKVKFQSAIQAAKNKYKTNKN